MIDGHNLLMSGDRRFSLARKDELTERLRAYTRARDVRVTLVFDSRSPAGAAFSETLGERMDVVYAPYPDEADDVILRRVREGVHDGRDLWVVTNDRRVADGARRARARVMGCGAFEDFLARQEQGGRRGRDDEAGDDPGEKPELPGGDIDYYLKKFGGR